MTNFQKTLALALFWLISCVIIPLGYMYGQSAPFAAPVTTSHPFYDAMRDDGMEPCQPGDEFYEDLSLLVSIYTDGDGNFYTRDFTGRMERIGLCKPHLWHVEDGGYETPGEHAQYLVNQFVGYPYGD